MYGKDTIYSKHGKASWYGYTLHQNCCYVIDALILCNYTGLSILLVGSLTSYWTNAEVVDEIERFTHMRRHLYDKSESIWYSFDMEFPFTTIIAINEACMNNRIKLEHLDEKHHRLSFTRYLSYIGAFLWFAKYDHFSVMNNWKCACIWLIIYDPFELQYHLIK